MRGLLCALLPLVWACPNRDRDWETCEYACSRSLRCEDGIVTESPAYYYFGRGPCRGIPVCPEQQALTCLEGCRTDGVTQLSDPRSPLSVMCEEGRPKRVGDPCETKEDCTPPGEVLDDAGPRREHLACDLSTGRCVRGGGGSIPDDWLEPCGLDPGLPYGLVTRAPACSEEYCIFVREADCTRQGCTRPCELNWECPDGSTCEERFTDGFATVTVCWPHMSLGTTCDW